MPPCADSVDPPNSSSASRTVSAVVEADTSIGSFAIANENARSGRSARPGAVALVASRNLQRRGLRREIARLEGEHDVEVLRDRAADGHLGRRLVFMVPE